jgi:integrase
MPAVYIEKRAHKFVAMMELPTNLRNSGIAGLPKRRFVATTDTGDERLANIRAKGLAAAWESMIDQARGSLNAAFYRRALAKLGAPVEIHEIVTVDLGDGRISEMDITTGKPVADGPILAPVRRLTKLATQIDGWLAKSEATQKTKDGQRATVLQLAKAFPHVEDIEDGAVNAWALSLLEGDEKIGKATLRRKLFFLGTFWRHLQSARKGLPAGNPFDPKVIIGKAKKSGRAVKADHRQAFSPVEIVGLIKAAHSAGDIELADFIDCSRWLGTRREELAQLRCEHIHLGDEIPHVEIIEGKSAAALRTIPCHAELLPVLDHLVAGRTDGFLFVALEAGKYDCRSNGVGRRFGALKTAEGHGPQYVLHSVRKTVASLLKNAGVPEFVAADILGHEIATMSYGTYAGDVDLATKAKAIAKLNYGKVKFD